MSSSDKALVTIGGIAAVLQGLAMPTMVIMFGEMTNSFDPGKSSDDTLGMFFAPLNLNLDDIKFLALVFALLGIGVYILSHVFFTFWVIVSENVGY